MADLKRCDRCGSVFNMDYTSKKEPWRYMIKNYMDEVDLCLECRKEFIRWLNNGTKNEDWLYKRFIERK